MQGARKTGAQECTMATATSPAAPRTLRRPHPRLRHAVEAAEIALAAAIIAAVVAILLGARAPARSELDLTRGPAAAAALAWGAAGARAPAA
jgi:hypothetical protein